LNTNKTVNLASLILGERGPRLDDPAELYLEASKYSPSNVQTQMAGAYILQQSESMQHTVTRSVKRYPHRPRLHLPEPSFPPICLKEVLLRRRTLRHYSQKEISLVDLSTLLEGGSGISGQVENKLGLTQFLRTVPSGGALYPFEVYSVIFEVEGVLPGLYHYDPLGRSLEEVRAGKFKECVAEASCGQDKLVTGCAVVFIITGMFWRTRFKYGLRGFRFVLMEVGHVAQNLLLTAEALDMAAVLLGGFYDDKVNEFMGIDGVNEAPLYLITVGYKSSKEEGKVTDVF